MRVANEARTCHVLFENRMSGPGVCTRLAMMLATDRLDVANGKRTLAIRVGWRIAGSLCRAWGDMGRAFLERGFVLFLLVVPPLAYAGPEPSLEYQVKASYLYNFVRFIDWPEPVRRGAKEFLICLLGEDRFGSALDVFQGEAVAGVPMAVKRYKELKELPRCDVVFVAASQAKDQRQIIQSLVGKNALTVGESPGFTENGGMINLVQVSGKIHFAINQSAAEREGLKISSRLLALAKEVR